MWRSRSLGPGLTERECSPGIQSGLWRYYHSDVAPWQSRLLRLTATPDDELRQFREPGRAVAERFQSRYRFAVQQTRLFLRCSEPGDARVRGFCPGGVGAGDFPHQLLVALDIENVVLNLERQSDAVGIASERVEFSAGELGIAQCAQQHTGANQGSGLHAMHGFEFVDSDGAPGA